jgi:hypothetical protein
MADSMLQYAAVGGCTTRRGRALCSPIGAVLQDRVQHGNRLALDGARSDWQKLMGYIAAAGAPTPAVCLQQNWGWSEP